MNIRLGDLPVGGLREIKGQELELLEKTLKEKPPVREVFRGGKPVKESGKIQDSREEKEELKERALMDKIERMKELIPVLQEASKAYYQEDREDHE